MFPGWSGQRSCRYCLPSHGEGRFIAAPEMMRRLAGSGQVATRYVDIGGHPTMDTAFNINGSMEAVEGVSSPDGRL